MKCALIILLLSVSFSSLQGQTEEASDSVSVAEENQVESEMEEPVEEPVEDTKKLVWVSLYGGSGLSQWNHTDDEVTCEPIVTIGGGIAFNFRITDWVEVSTGARILSFSPELTVDEFNATMSAVDSDGDEYERRISASDVVEKQDYIWAGFPVSLRYVFNPGRWDLFAEAGGEYRVALKSSFDQTGTFSQHGYYSDYDLLIDDLPSFGFYNENEMNTEGDLDAGGLIMPFVGAGVVFPGKDSHFFIEGRYYFPNDDPFSEKQDLLFSGPEDNEDVLYFNHKSMMKSGEVTLSGFRGVVGIRF